MVQVSSTGVMMLLNREYTDGHLDRAKDHTSKALASTIQGHINTLKGASTAVAPAVASAVSSSSPIPVGVKAENVQAPESGPLKLQGNMKVRDLETNVPKIWEPKFGGLVGKPKITVDVDWNSVKNNPAATVALWMLDEKSVLQDTFDAIKNICTDATMKSLLSDELKKISIIVSPQLPNKIHMTDGVLSLNLALGVGLQAKPTFGDIKKAIDSAT